MPLYPPQLEYQYNPPDRGYLAESLQPSYLTSSLTLPTAGRLELVRLILPYPVSVTSIVLGVQTAGSTLTAGQCFAALYTAAGALVAQSADQAANWAGTGMKSATLTSGPFSCAAGHYYVGMWFNGTTGPTMARGSSLIGAIANAGLSAPNFRGATADTGLTTTAPPNLGTQTASGSTFYAALI